MSAFLLAIMSHIFHFPWVFQAFYKSSDLPEFPWDFDNFSNSLNFSGLWPPCLFTRALQIINIQILFISNYVYIHLLQSYYHTITIYQSIQMINLRKLMSLVSPDPKSQRSVSRASISFFSNNQTSLWRLKNFHGLSYPAEANIFGS